MSTSEARHLIERAQDGSRREDGLRLLDLMTETTGEEPMVDGKTIGFGSYHYRYETGREGDFFKVGFAPTRQGLTLYVMSGLRGFDDILTRLGPHKTSKSTVKINHLDDVDQGALVELISECVRHIDEVEAEMGAIPRMSDIPPRTVE
ncbi:MAG: DUF1801 domain-containing protein [Acidimicrobiia bacterium]|jgi:hypothetical protein